MAPRQPSAPARLIGPTNRFIEFAKSEVEQSIPKRFEEQVRRYAERTAIRSKNHDLTYAALNRAANRVAHAILARREQQRPIALLLGHDAPMIAATLGVLKAGRIYVPLDTAHPQARLAAILEDSGASLLITESTLLAQARDLAGQRLDVMDVAEIDSQSARADPGLSLSPHTPAYILYTSGSTGTPKGVAQTHHNVLYFVRSSTNALHTSADDRTTLLFSSSLSGGVSNLFGALLNGAVLFPFDLREEGIGALATWLLQERITIYRSVISVFRQFVSTLTGGETFPDLRLIHVGGELVWKSDVELYRRHFPPGCLFVNALGFTEVHGVTHFFVDQHTEIVGSTVPVGYPTEDNELLLLDEAGHELGADEVGEIAIRSPYLAPGYWRNSELTRIAFPSDPAHGSGRVYRTGDLGRLRADGCLELLGRKDFQVKIRGFRVDVAEVEAAVVQLPGIKEAAVIARQDHAGDTRLAAYLVVEGDESYGVDRMRSSLTARLPEYMIPSDFVLLDALPLSSNGKIDRRALPAPSRARPVLDVAFLAPRTRLEQEIAETWADILSLDAVGVDDDFLALGGDSLRATRVAARLLDRFELDLPVPTLLRANTVARIAEAILQHRTNQIQRNHLAALLSEVERLTDQEVASRLVEEPS